MDREHSRARRGPLRRGGSLSLRAAFDRARPELVAGTPLWNDPSFAALVAGCPRLEALHAFLPRRLDMESFTGQARIAALESSYKDHGYGHLLYALARVLQPDVCVELGVFHGFSLLSVAAALRDNARGRIDGFDLFGDYPYRHVARDDAVENVRASGLGERAYVHQEEAFAVHERFPAVDWLHVDVSNNGDTYRRVFDQWAAKVRQVILLEGGSPERDEVEWMREFRKPAIVPAVEALRRSHPQWKIGVLAPFPSMTIALREEHCR